jgi:two-component system nitrate/nitrite response regulator NarL
MQVLLIDDHTLFRLGLKGLLERSGIEVIAASTGENGLRIAKELEPDVILLDMRMPNMDGLDVLKALREQGVQSPITMLTTSTDENDLVRTLRNGAQGYLLKDMDPKDLIAALQKIQQGETVVAPQLTGTLARALQDKPTAEPPKTPLSEVTPREREIISHLAEQ